MEDIIRSNNMWVDTSFNEDSLQLKHNQRSYSFNSMGEGLSSTTPSRTPNSISNTPSSASRHRRNASYDTDGEIMSSLSPRRRYQLSSSETSSRSISASKSPVHQLHSKSPPQEVFNFLNYESDNDIIPVKDSNQSESRRYSDRSDRSDRDKRRDSSGRSPTSKGSNKSSGTSSETGSARRSSGRSDRRSSKSTTSSRRDGSKQHRESKNNGLPSRDETIYLQTFYKVLTSFNNKQKASLNLQDCGTHAEPMYRRVVFEIIEKLNKDARKCTSTQQELVLQSVTLICSDTSPDTEIALQVAVDDVLTFFLSSFYTVLSSRNKHPLLMSEEENLKSIINLVGVLALKSEFFRKKIEKRQVFRRLTDKILSKFTSTTSLSTEEGDDVVNAIVDIALKSQLLFKLLLDIKTVLISTAEHLDDTGVSEDNDTAVVISRHLSKAQDALSSVLFKSRTTIRSLIEQKEFTAEDKVQFTESHLIPRLIKCCPPTDLSGCSHLLKLITIFGEQPLLEYAMWEEHSSEIITIFLNTMRCEVVTFEDSLMKFWLMKRICSNPCCRDLLFRSEGVILEIMMVMRIVNIDAGESLSLLSSFYNDIFFLDMSLTTAQVIQYVGGCFQSGETDLMRRQAGDLLQLFAAGLNTPNPGFESRLQSESGIESVSSISNSFLDSGFLFSLVNVISAEECGAEWLERATGLLCTLVSDEAIRHFFITEPIGILHCLVTSLDSYKGRRSVFKSLITVLEVVITDPTTHPRLFESDIIFDLAEHLKDTLSTEEVSTVIKNENVLHTLNIFDLITSLSRESCQIFKQMELEAFLGLFQHHDRKEVRDMASGILAKLGPNQWKKLILKAKKLF